MSKALYHDTAGAMMRLLRMHRSACEKQIKSLNIHHSQHKMLMYIYRCENAHPTQVQISQHFDISAAAVAVSIKKLEASGFIKRSTNRDDMRNNYVTVTKKGKEICEASKNIFDSIDKTMFDGMSPDDIALFKKCIDTMTKNFSKGERE